MKKRPLAEMLKAIGEHEAEIRRLKKALATKSTDITLTFWDDTVSDTVADLAFSGSVTRSRVRRFLFSEIRVHQRAIKALATTGFFLVVSEEKLKSITTKRKVKK